MKTISHLSGLLGDSVCAFPAIQTKAAEEKDGIALWMENKAVQELLPANPKIKLLTERPEKPDYVMEAGPVFNRFVYTHHMRQGYFSCLNLTIPTEVPPIEYQKKEKIAGIDFDILISPFSRSDHNHNKKWYDDRWYAVVRRLTEEGYRVLVVGGQEDANTDTAQVFLQAVHDTQGEDETQVKGVYGSKLGALMDLIERAKLCITLDNGISHLVSAAKTPHLLLYPGCLPYPWVSNPNDVAHHIHDQPINITVDRVLYELNHLLPKYVGEKQPHDVALSSGETHEREST